MLSRIRPWHHIVVGIVIALMALLAGVRVIGAGDDACSGRESFDSKQVTIWPEGDDGVRVREIVDIDFGLNERHGYQRIIPNDFGVPESVTVVTEADDTLNVVDLGDETRIRVGDPNITYHRPAPVRARVRAARCRAEFRRARPRRHRQRRDVRRPIASRWCSPASTSDHGLRHRRRTASFGGCDLVEGRHRQLRGRHRTARAARRHHRRRADRRVRRRRAAAAPRAARRPPLRIRPARSADDPDRRSSAPRCAFFWNRRRGSNDVGGAGGAADAAFGGLPRPARQRDARQRRLDTPGDRQGLARMATIEFVPPRGLEPWQGMALLARAVDDETVLGLVLRHGRPGGAGRHRLAGGCTRWHRAEAGPGVARRSGPLARLFAAESTIELGTYDPDFAATWSNVARRAAGLHPASPDGGTPRPGRAAAVRSWSTGA